MSLLSRMHLWCPRLSHHLLHRRFVVLLVVLTAVFLLPPMLSRALRSIEVPSWYTPGSDGTFAQNYQDVWVLAVAHRFKWLGHTNYFLDIGAADGLRCSNTALLERELGWQGMCVEPFPTNFEEGKRTCQVIQRAMHPDDNRYVTFAGSGRMRSLVDSHPFTLESASSSSTLSHSEREKRARLEEQELLSRSSLSLSPTVLVRDYLPWLQTSAGTEKNLRFVSLAVEGLELAIVEAWPFSKIRPSVWIIQHHGNRTMFNSIHRILTKHRYVHLNVDNSAADAYFVLVEFVAAMPSIRKKAFRVHPFGSGGC